MRTRSWSHSQRSRQRFGRRSDDGGYLLFREGWRNLPCPERAPASARSVRRHQHRTSLEALALELRCKALLFDLDGVLVDSQAVVERTWRRWAERHRVDADAILRAAHGRRTS